MPPKNFHQRDVCYWPRYSRYLWYQVMPSLDYLICQYINWAHLSLWSVVLMHTEKFDKLLHLKNWPLKILLTFRLSYFWIETGNVSKILTLILPTPKVISFCHQYRARPACTCLQSDQALNCWQTNFKFLSWYS